ncbi:50S ribosomal protein L7Ae [Frankliniella fusca]|uniref:50S ribosomal protein L7Ae n=1 Tax=Frankliniella fusca TaxID=407009 RepID=A0AAE1HYM4_9NEOP|nr:50S ribosomal protein L7Ae [Frankliniella fusca]
MLSKVSCEQKKSELVTRRKTEEWLVGHPLTSVITGSRLPSRGQVLRRFIFYHEVNGKTVRSSSHLVLQEIKPFWDKSRVPYQYDNKMIKKIENLYEEYVQLKKNKNKTSKASEEKRARFVKEMDLLFDVSHQDAETLTENKEDYLFLLAQREEGRRGCMASVDMKLAHTEKVLTDRMRKREQRAEEEKARKRRSDEQIADLFGKVKEEIEEENDIDIVVPKVKEEGDFSVRSREKNEVQPFVTPAIAAAVARTKLSTRNALHVFKATVESHTIPAAKLSYGSVYRAKRTHTHNLAAAVKSNYKAVGVLVVHWDGKLLKNTATDEKQERLAILVSSGDTEQLLGVPTISRSSGEAQASAVVEALSEWGLADDIYGGCFDTTSSNSGHLGGACVLIEKKLDRKMLHLACRHHIFELTLEAAFSAAMGTSKNPEILPLFGKFSNAWPEINKENYSPAGRQILRKFPSDPDEMLIFCKSQLQEFNARDDYRELLELSIIYLGGVPDRGISFLKPGAIHKARWMARAIYSLKIFLFREQFPLSPAEKKGVNDICSFIVSAYVTVWFQAPSAISAPRVDLQYLKLLKKNCKPGNLWEAALTKMLRHLWYLSSDLSPLSFYDDLVSFETKREMVKALKDEVGDEDPPKRVNLSSKLIKDDLDQSFFVTQQSVFFFESLKLSVEVLLENDPSTWSSNEVYCRDQTVVRHLRVVNDVAERGVKLISEYCNILTKNEQEKQDLLLVVAEHRKENPCK